MSVVLRCLAAVLLVVAAVLKGSTYPDLSPAPLLFEWNRQAIAIVIMLELALAVVLLIAPATWARLTGMVVFLSFAMYAIWLLTRGEDSCGCFGSLQIPPAVILTVDLLFVVGFASLSSSRRVLSSRRAAATTIVCSLVAGGVSLWQLVPLQWDKHGVAIYNNGYAALEPEAWVGEPLPLHGLVEGIDELSSYRHVVFVSPGCERCEQLLARFVATIGDRYSIAVISIGEEWSASAQSLGLANGRLSPAYNWVAMTPVFVDLDDNGVVTNLAIQELPSIDESGRASGSG